MYGSRITNQSTIAFGWTAKASLLLPVIEALYFKCRDRTLSKKVLLVGLDYSGPNIIEVEIETLGLCRPEIDEDKAAYALYEYDLIVINPQSYSHFIFGSAGEKV
jgi:hypothetical protein